MNEENLASEVRTLYRADPSRAESAIESILQKTWRSYPSSEWPALMDRLLEHFRDKDSDRSAKRSAETGELYRLLSLLLGERISTLDLSSEEFSERLGYSLKTIFDTLNQIVGVIHTTLLGRTNELKTIRRIIGSALKEEGQSEPLQHYLNQIKEAFLISHHAFRQTAQSKINDLLNQLDPERISQLGQKGFSFAPFHKAKLLEIYKEEYMKCKNGVESGRFMEEMLREFERNCQRLYQNDQRKSS